MKYKTVEEANEAYLNYIKNHQHNCILVGKLFFPGYIADTYGTDAINAMFDVLTHDNSKLNPEEFEPYRKHFYPVEGEEPDEIGYEVAWETHYATNPHHWEYHLNTDGTPAPIPKRDLLHLLVDWGAMSVFQNNMVSEWYFKNKDIKLHPDTKQELESLFPYIDNVVSILQLKTHEKEI